MERSAEDIAAAVLDRYGTTFARDAGIALTDEPAPLFQLLVLAQLLSARIGAGIAVATAAELFAARGFHGVSVGDLGAACGVSGPAIYKHFASKEAILASMLVRISEELLVGGRERVAAPARRRGRVGS